MSGNIKCENKGCRNDAIVQVSYGAPTGQYSGYLCRDCDDEIYDTRRWTWANKRLLGVASVAAIQPHGLRDD